MYRGINDDRADEDLEDDGYDPDEVDGLGRGNRVA